MDESSTNDGDDPEAIAERELLEAMFAFTRDKPMESADLTPSTSSTEPVAVDPNATRLLVPGSVEWAETVAFAALEPLGPRWLHTQGVADQARTVQGVLPIRDRRTLVAAAYLHDIGYAGVLAHTGFHPLDGARWLAARGLDRLAGLVAHHTGARFEAAIRGLDYELAEFAEGSPAISAALAYCDLTTGPEGQPMTPAERLADIEARHGRDSVVTRGLRLGWPELLACVEWVDEEMGERYPR